MTDATVAPAITLRFMTREDVPDLYRFYLADPLSLQIICVFGIDWMLKGVDDSTQWRFAIEQYGRLVGSCSLSWTQRETGILSPSMLIDPGYQRLGVGTAAMKLLWQFALDEIGMFRKVRGCVYDFNDASNGMCRKFFGAPEATFQREVFHKGKWWPMHWYVKFREDA